MLLLEQIHEKRTAQLGIYASNSHFVLDAKESRQNFMDFIGRLTFQMHASCYPVKHRHEELFLCQYPANIHEIPNNYLSNKPLYIPLCKINTN
jgi:hypothetical protein